MAQLSQCHYISQFMPLIGNLFVIKIIRIFTTIVIFVVFSAQGFAEDGNNFADGLKRELELRVKPADEYINAVCTLIDSGDIEVDFKYPLPLQNEKEFHELLNFLKSQDYKLAVSAVLYLKQFRPNDINTHLALIDAFDHQSFCVTQVAGWALRKIRPKSKPVIQKLIQIVSQGSDVQHDYKASNLLALLLTPNDEHEIEQLIDILQNTSLDASAEIVLSQIKPLNEKVLIRLMDTLTRSYAEFPYKGGVYSDEVRSKVIKLRFNIESVLVAQTPESLFLQKAIAELLKKEDLSYEFKMQLLLILRLGNDIKAIIDQSILDAIEQESAKLRK